MPRNRLKNAGKDEHGLCFTRSFACRISPVRMSLSGVLEQAFLELKGVIARRTFSGHFSINFRESIS